MRARLLRIVLAVVLAGLGQAACGGGTQHCPPNERVQIRFVESLAEYGPYYGITLLDCGETTQILILESTPPSLWSRLLTHELLHAAGLRDHEPDTNCYLYEDILGGLLTVPCPQEVARLLAVKETFDVELLEPVMVPNLEVAAEILNEAAGRFVFVPVPISPP